MSSYQCDDAHKREHANAVHVVAIGYCLHHVTTDGRRNNMALLGATGRCDEARPLTVYSNSTG